MEYIGKFKSRNFGVLLAVAFISCCAFVFLNTVQSDSNKSQRSDLKSGAIEVDEVSDKENSRTLKGDYFPEILAAKRVIELMRKFIPAS